MKARPIIFSAEQVRAILDGRQTQTRRICKSQPYSNGFCFDGKDILCHNDYLPPSAMLMDIGGRYAYTTSNLEGWEAECPYGWPGDRLWVREAWRTLRKWDDFAPRNLADDRSKITYEADAENRNPLWSFGRARPSIHMPRWASRIDLEVTGVRVERLQDISEADAQAEGCALECMTPTGDDSGCAIYGPGGFKALWESINGAGSWDANPWVWVVEFKRV